MTTVSLVLLSGIYDVENSGLICLAFLGKMCDASLSCSSSGAMFVAPVPQQQTPTRQCRDRPAEFESEGTTACGS